MFSPFFCRRTRRLAPNHILRRSEVRSVLRLGNSAQLRVVVCARGGEEAVLHFDLSLDKRSRWVVNAITRDAESDAEVPTGLHPRHSPESVVIAQLQALQANDAAYAARYAVQDSARYLCYKTFFAFFLTFCGGMCISDGDTYE